DGEPAPGRRRGASALSRGTAGGGRRSVPLGLGHAENHTALGRVESGQGGNAGSDRIPGMARANPRPKSDPAEVRSGEDAPNPVWFRPVMFGFMLVGLAWI